MNCDFANLKNLQSQLNSALKLHRNPKYKTVASFVQQTDQNAYNEAKAKMFVGREKVKNNEKYAFEIAWLEDNHEEIGQEDITIINPENQKEVVLKKGKKSILKEFKLCLAIVRWLISLNQILICSMAI